MPPFLASILSSVIGGAVAEPAGAAIRAMLARTGRIGEPRSSSRPAPQLAPPRVELTPPVSYGPPVPAMRPGTASSIAAKLAARR